MHMRNIRSAFPAMIIVVISLILCAIYSLSLADSQPNSSFIIEFYSNTSAEDTQVFSTQIKNAGADLIIQDKFPSVDYKNFIGWSTEASAVQPDYFPGDRYSLDSSLKLYAVWADPYELNVIQAPSTITHEPLPVSDNMWFTFSVPEDGYYHFYTNNQHKIHGASSSTGIYTRLGSGDFYYYDTLVRDTDLTTSDIDLMSYLTVDNIYYLSVYVGNETSLTMECERISAYIEYFSNTGSGNNNVFSTQIKKEGEILKIQEEFPNVDYVNFLGWSSNENASVPEYLPGDEYSKAGTAKLYAVWSPPFNLGEIASSFIIEQEALAVSDSVWFSFSVSNAGYYHFYTNNHHKQHGSSSGTGIYGREELETYSYYDSIVQDTDLTTADIDLVAYLEPGKEYQLSVYIAKGQSLTMYCEIVNTYIEYYSNLGTINEKTFLTQIKQQNEEIIIQEKFPSVDYRNFMGWSTDSNSLSPEYLPGDTYNENGSIKLYAVWAAPFDLGEITGRCTIEHDALSVSDNMWFSFEVSEAGYYHFFTKNHHKRFGASSRTGIYTQVNSYGYLHYDSLVQDTDLTTDEVDFIVFLSPENLYYLSVYVASAQTSGSTPLQMHCEPVYDNIPLSPSFILPDDLQIIEPYAFENCPITSVSIPQNVTKIKEYAFSNCSSLQIVIIHSTAIDINSLAFSGCSRELLIVAPLESTAYSFAKEHHLNFRRLDNNM